MRLVRNRATNFFFKDVFAFPVTAFCNSQLVFTTVRVFCVNNLESLFNVSSTISWEVVPNPGEKTEISAKN